MKKYIILIPLFITLCLPCLCQIEVVNANDIDSLLELSQNLKDSNQFEQALEIVDLVYAYFIEQDEVFSESYAKCLFEKARILYMLNRWPEAQEVIHRAVELYTHYSVIDSIQYGNVHKFHVSMLSRAGRYNEALDVARTTMEWYQTISYHQTEKYGDLLYDMIILEMHLENYDQAIIYANQLLLLREKLDGSQHKNYFNTLLLTGVVYFMQQNYEMAEQYYVRCKQLLESQENTISLDYARVLNNLGGVYQYVGDIRDTEQYYEQSTKIILELKGEYSEDHASCLNNLGSFHYGVSRFELSLEYFRGALAIRDSIGLQNHPYFPTNLRYIANCLTKLGRFYEAEPYIKKAESINSKLYGQGSIHHLRSKELLGILYIQMGKYAMADSILNEVKNAFLKIERADSKNVLSVQIHLGILYHTMANWDGAERQFTEALSNIDTIDFHSYSIYWKTLNNLGMVYTRQKKFELAEAYYHEALRLIKIHYSEKSHDYILALGNLGSFYLYSGDFDKAEEYTIRSMESAKQHFGTSNSFYFTCLGNLSSLYIATTQLDKANEMVTEAISIGESLYSRRNQHFGFALENWILLQSKLGNVLEVEMAIQELSELRKNALMEAASYQSESELAAYTASIQKVQNMSLSNTALFPNSKIIAEVAFDNTLFVKGFVQSELRKSWKIATAYPDMAPLYKKWGFLKERIAREISKPLSERIDVREWEDEASMLEKELIRQVRTFRDTRQTISWKEVVQQLQPGEAVVEFVHYYHNTDSTTEYGALLLRQDSEYPLFIKLFTEDQIARQLDGKTSHRADYVNDLYSWAERGRIQLGSRNPTLYELIWRPIEQTGLKGIETIYFSPSGILQRINIGAISTDDVQCLADRYHFIQIGSSRQIVVPETETPKNNHLLIVGDVTYDFSNDQHAVDTTQNYANRNEYSFNRSGIEIWLELKWTKREVTQVSETAQIAGLPVHLLTGLDAREETIKQTFHIDSISPYVFHLATHGFFFPDPEVNHNRLDLGESESAFKLSDNPMIRSGLILAGGNYAWQYGKALGPDMEDGILTAFEISQMNLSNTELVVLSACETGLGDIQGNEGVYGLQRAFKIAGAKYLIMSLWQVPDRETMEFMTTFYKNWLPSDAEALAGKEVKMSIPDAFRKTQREMRDRFYNPYSWAGFVLVE